jgi:predicted RNA-binding Zn-ribbon protein involved in translation (DUF1610 family)
MAPIRNWSKVNSGTKEQWKNRETGALAVVARGPEGYFYDWIACIFHRGYPVYSRGEDTKNEAKPALISELRDRPAPEVECRECGQTDLRIGSKSKGPGTKKRWYDCPECGYSGEGQIVYEDLRRT